MKFTGGNTLPNIGRRINWQLITLAGGLTIAVSSAIAFGALDSKSHHAGTVRTDSLPPRLTMLTPPPGIQARVAARDGDAKTPPTELRHLVVIVSSQEQASALEEAMGRDEMAAFMEGYVGPFRPMSFVIVGSPDEQHRYDAVIADEMGDGTFDVIDLRD